MTLKSDVKFEEKLTLGSQNGIRNLVSFNASSSKSENLHFDVPLLLRVYLFEPKMYREVMCYNTEEWCKIWGGNDLLLKKLHGNFWHFGTALKSFKIWTLMGPIWPKYVIFELKKYRVTLLHCTEDQGKLWRKNDLWFHKWHEWRLW